MRQHLQNFLSDADKDVVYSGYKRRLFIVFAWSLFFALIILVTSLLPSIFVSGAKLQSISVQAIDEGVLEEQSEILGFPEYINKLTEKVLSFKSLPKVFDKVSEIKSLATIGVDIVSINYFKSDNQENINISGFAIDRASLLEFENQVSELAFVQNASVPVESFARDTNLSFDMKVKLK